MLTVIRTFDCVNVVAGLRHNAFAASASSFKVAFALYFFNALHALISYYDA